MVNLPVSRFSPLLHLFFLVTAVLWSSDRLEGVSLFTQNGMLYLPVTLTDQQGYASEVLFQMDTGSLGTFVDSRYFKADDWTREDFETTILTQDGPTTSRQRATIPKLSVGGKPFLSLRLPVVTDLFDKVEVDQGDHRHRPVVGVMGADLLFRQSCTLSVARQEFSWVAEPPWEPDGSIELFSLFGLGWYVRAPFPGQGRVLSYLIDTGTFAVFVPQEFLDPWQTANPKEWLRWSRANGSPYHDSIGAHEWGDPFGPERPRPLSVMGIPGGSQVSLGTEVLSQWDLWFDIHGYMMADLHLRKVPPEATQAFLAGVDKSAWGFETETWGFRLDELTGRVKWLLSWGDGTPLTHDIEIGDRLVSVDGIPWRPGAGNPLPKTSGAATLEWEREGHSFVTTLQSQEVHRP